MGGPSDAREGVFYGWWVAGAAFVVLFLSVGAGLYAPPVFLVPLDEHFGWSRAGISGAMALAALVSAGAAPLAGIWIDRFGARRVMSLGALGMGLAYLGLAGIGSLWHLYVLNAIAALGLSCTAWVPCQTLVASWFEARRGLAMGLALAGIGFGGLAMAPFADLLIDRLGWRAAFGVLGLLVLGVATSVILLVVRSRPEDVGLRPDGAPAPPAGPDAGADPAGGLAIGEALRTRAFALLSLVAFLSTFSSLSVVAHVVAFLRDEGFERALSAGALGLVVGTSVAGRVLFGAVADRLPKQGVLAAAFLLHAAGAAALLRIEAGPALPLFVALFGLGLGGGAVGLPLLVGECFGLRAFGRLLGLVMVSSALGAAVGPVLTGHLFDATGGYELAWRIHVGAFLAGALLLALLRPPAAASEARLPGRRSPPSGPDPQAGSRRSRKPEGAWGPMASCSRMPRPSREP